MNDLDLYSDARKVAREVVETAKELNNLETAVLFATTAGLIALAFLIHVIFWVPASMAVALVFFRFLLYYVGRRDNARQVNLELYDDIEERKRRLHTSDLPEEEKRQMSGVLDEFLVPASDKAKVLVPAKKPKRFSS